MRIFCGRALRKNESNSHASAAKSPSGAWLKSAIICMHPAGRPIIYASGATEVLNKLSGARNRRGPALWRLQIYQAAKNGRTGCINDADIFPRVCVTMTMAAIILSVTHLE